MRDKRKKIKAKISSQALQKQTREKANNNGKTESIDDRDETKYRQLKNKEQAYAQYMNGVSFREKKIICSPGVALDDNNNINNSNSNTNRYALDVGNGLSDQGHEHGLDTFKMHKLPTEQFTLVSFKFEDVLCANTISPTHKTARTIANTDSSNVSNL